MEDRNNKAEAARLMKEQGKTLVIIGHPLSIKDKINIHKLLRTELSPKSQQNQSRARKGV